MTSPVRWVQTNDGVLKSGIAPGDQQYQRMGPSGGPGKPSGTASLGRWLAEKTQDAHVSEWTSHWHTRRRGKPLQSSVNYLSLMEVLRRL